MTYSASHISGAPPGESLSSGLAGATDDQIRQYWGGAARHDLTQPGAYEWWYFHAISPQGDGILCSLFEGLPFHPKYLEHLNRYSLVGRKKVRHTLQASHYPAAYLAVYRRGKRVAQFLNLYPPESSTSADAEVRVGPNRITLRQDGSFGVLARGYPFELVGARPRKRKDRILAAELTFTPSYPGVRHTRPFRAPDRKGAAHHWVLAAPHGTMTGGVRLLDAQNQAEWEMPIDALGYHDHVYGHGGLGAGAKTLLWGFIQGETWTAAWHQTLTGAATHDRADGMVFFQRDEPPIVIEAPETRLSQSRVSNWFLRHPGKVAMHGSDAHGHSLELLLTHPAVLDTAPFHTHLAAEGTVTLPGMGLGAMTGRGATHVLRLRRLRWPVLSDLTLLTITPVARDDPIWE